MTSDDDKAKLGERLTGHHDPKDPDGLLTVPDATSDPEPEPGPKIAAWQRPDARD